jgi:hypothetical protein
VNYPIRQKSLRGQPKPGTSIERCCACCGASFIGLGKTEEGGIWHDWRWYCSVECHELDQEAEEERRINRSILRLLGGRVEHGPNR